MGRGLGRFERLSLSYAQLGHPSTIAFVVTFKSSCALSSAAIEERLPGAVAHLLAQYPLLRSSVADRNTRKPSYSVRDVTPGQVILTAQDSTSSVDKLLLDAFTHAKEVNLDEEPLWRIAFHPSKDKQESRLVLYLNHIICDGMGSRTLVAELLSLLVHPTECQEPPHSAAVTLPPTVEDSINMKPGLGCLLHAAYEELLVPILPSFIRPKMKDFWPNPPTKPVPGQAHLSIKTALFPFDVATSLKAVGKSHGIATLHPLLHVCLYSALRHATNSLRSAKSGKPVKLVSQTPISLRDFSVGHPTATGNYVASLEVHDKIRLESPFFAQCRDYAAVLNSPSKRRKAKMNIGILALVPDPKVKPGATQTGWETFFGDSMQGPTPFRESLCVSNLGVLPLPSELEGQVDVFWAQTAIPIGAGIYVQLLTTKEGSLTASAVWLTEVVAPQVIDNFWTTFQLLVTRLSSGDAQEEATVNQMLSVVPTSKQG